MGKYRDHRQPRGRRFEDAQGVDFEPSYFQQQAVPRRPTICPEGASKPSEDVTLLWFNADKGFGFVMLGDGSEAFLHGSRMEAAGYSDLPNGTGLTVSLEVGHKGPQVTKVLKAGVGVKSDPVPSAKRRSSQSQQGQVERESAGVVKRYDPLKGFGFIAVEEGDVFVHATALTRSGVPPLEAGQYVFVSYGQGRKGLEVRNVRIL